MPPPPGPGRQQRNPRLELALRCFEPVVDQGRENADHMGAKGPGAGQPQDNRSRRGIDLEGPPPNRPNHPHTTPVESATSTVSGHPRTHPGPGSPPTRCPVRRGSVGGSVPAGATGATEERPLWFLFLSVALSDALLPITRRTSRFGGAGGAIDLGAFRPVLSRHRRLCVSVARRWRGGVSVARRGLAQPSGTGARPGRAPPKGGRGVGPSVAPRHRAGCPPGLEGGRPVSPCTSPGGPLPW